MIYKRTFLVEFHVVIFYLRKIGMWQGPLLTSFLSLYVNIYVRPPSFVHQARSMKTRTQHANNVH